MDKNTTLYVTDLDGTLMRDDKTVSDTTAAILNRFCENVIKDATTTDSTKS